MSSAASRPPQPQSDCGGPPRLAGRWQVALLGRIEARNGELLITRFNSQPTAALLARLALQPQRMHPREELAELLWPGAPADVGRNRLRQALSTLKRLLEPPGLEGPPVLLADRLGVRINEQAVVCDALEFERCVRQRRWQPAHDLYRGELMPGCYDEWVLEERRRLAALFERLGAVPEAPGEGDPEDAAAADAASSETTSAAPPSAARGLAPGLPPAQASSLPLQLTRFFGREAECAELRAACADARLVTVTGVGGCGKTRLVLEAARLLTGFERVVFVPLADCLTPAQVLSQLRATLQVDAGTQDLLESVAQSLVQGRVLLVLDNFEQLVACGGPELVESLLARVPSLHLWVSSRRVLGVAGERELPLAPLPLPEAGAALEDLARNPGAALFVDRARSVRPDFALTPRNHEALGSLCRALEGVPLALELAAARSRAFSLRELNDALARPLALLQRTGARAGRVPRHDSLRGAIEWSWRLLDARQQGFLAALSVFRGGCRTADAQAVCDEPGARELLESLLADSLLSAGPAHEGPGGMRFRMLELIRDFVAAKLEPERARALRAQHRAHVLTLALGLQARGGHALDADELPNVQQAIRSAIEDGQADLALTLGVALRSHWESQGIDPELLALLCRAADGAPAGLPALSQACTMLSQLLLNAGDVPAARAMAERALVLAEDRPLARASALCAWVRVVVSGERRFDGLGPRLDEALRLSGGQHELLAQIHTLQGVVVLGQHGDPGLAEVLFERAAAHWRAAGRAREARLLRYDRAISLMDARRLPEALAQAECCERECRAGGDRARGAAAINLQGVVLSKQRRWDAALQAYGRCVREAWNHHLHYWLAFALWNHGRNLARLRQPLRAAQIMAFAAQHWTRHFGVLDAADRRYERLVWRLVRAQLGRAATERAWEQGQTLTLQEAVALALQGAAATTAAVDSN